MRSFETKLRAYSVISPCRCDANRAKCAEISRHWRDDTQMFPICLALFAGLGATLLVLSALLSLYWVGD